jgi:hypothetical protein
MGRTIRETGKDEKDGKDGTDATDGYLIPSAARDLIVPWSLFALSG